VHRFGVHCNYFTATAAGKKSRYTDDAKDVSVKTRANWWRLEEVREDGAAGIKGKGDKALMEAVKRWRYTSGPAVRFG